MKTLLSILSALILSSCNDEIKVTPIQSAVENSKQVKAQLVDSLGFVTFSVPLRYDTSFFWTHFSDCGKSCEKLKYRWQPGNLTINKESGWYWDDPVDSVDKFTISHSGWFPFRTLDTSYIEILHLHLKEEVVKDMRTYKIKYDTIEKINDRKFSIIAIDIYDSSKALYSKKLIGTTTIKGNGIEFKYEFLSRKKDSINQNFIENSLRLLKTVKLSKGI